VLVAASARLAGAVKIVVTDLFDEALAIASRMGATEVVNVRTNEARLAAFTRDGGYFDVALDAISAFELASDRSKAMKVSLVAID
jgi:L-idonate 5-dehydrogenase